MTPGDAVACAGMPATPPRRMPAPWRATAAVAALVAVAALAGCARAGGDAFQATVTDAVRVDERPAGQTFRPGADRLAGVDLLIATFGERPDPEGRLVVTLADHDSGEAVASAELGADALADENRWVPVRFDEPAPAPETAALTVEWTGGSPVGVWANVPPADADPDERLVNDPYPGGQLLRGGEPAAGDLAFRVVGDVGADEPLRALARLAGGAVRSLATAPAFGLAWAVLTLGAVGLAVAGFRAARSR